VLVFAFFDVPKRPFYGIGSEKRVHRYLMEIFSELGSKAGHRRSLKTNAAFCRPKVWNRRSMGNAPLGSVEATGEIVANWDPSAAADPRLIEIHAHWHARCRGRPMPSRADIDPTQIPPRLLPFIFLVEVLNEPRDFRFRLAGTHFRDFTGAEATGQLIADVFPPEFCAEVRYHWNSSVDRKAPKIGAGKLWVPGKSHIGWEGIVLPLSPDGEHVNMLLGAVIFKL
jgi:hypothetical protein